MLHVNGNGLATLQKAQLLLPSSRQKCLLDLVATFGQVRPAYINDSILLCHRQLPTSEERFSMSLRFGLFVPQGWRMDLLGIADPVEAYETMARVALEAEALGYHSVWLFDHFHTVPAPSQEVTFECWSSTAALARDTRRIRIGQMVTCNGYRHPAGQDGQYRRCAQSWTA